MLWKIAFAAAPQQAPALAEAIEPYCLAVGWFGAEDEPVWRVEGIAAGPPDPARFHGALAAVGLALDIRPPDLHIAPLPEQDWVRESLATFRPVQVGRYRIKGTHIAEPRRPGITLTLDAGLAFGTGEHASTQGCLRLLDRLARLRHAGGRAFARRFARVLDLGCGTGVLAMAAAATWKAARITASDIDPVAVATARENFRANRLARRIRALAADGLAGRALRRPGGFDLIFANILARPLIRLARPIRRALAPGGIAVLSGFVSADATWVGASYRALGLREVARIDREGWTALALQRSGKTETARANRRV